MSLEIFRNYVSYYKKNKNRLIQTISNVFINKSINIDEEFINLFNKDDFEIFFKEFLQNTYSKSELNDYFIVFHLIISNVELQASLLNIFNSLGYTTYYKVIQDFITNSELVKNKDFREMTENLSQYLIETPSIQKAWNNLIIKNEPGLLIKLAKMGSNVDCFMQLQNNNLTSNDLDMLRNYNNELKNYWINAYITQNNKQKNLYNTISYSSLEDYLERNQDLNSNMKMLIKYVEVNGAIETSKINLMKSFVRNLELYKFTKENQPIYLNSESKFDKNYPKYSVFMNKNWKLIDELVYLDKNTILNKNVVKKIIKF